MREAVPSEVPHALFLGMNSICGGWSEAEMIAAQDLPPHTNNNTNSNNTSNNTNNINNNNNNNNNNTNTLKISAGCKAAGCDGYDADHTTLCTYAPHHTLSAYLGDETKLVLNDKITQSKYSTARKLLAKPDNITDPYTRKIAQNRNIEVHLRLRVIVNYINKRCTTS